MISDGNYYFTEIAFEQSLLFPNLGSSSLFFCGPIMLAGCQSGQFHLAQLGIRHLLDYAIAHGR